MSLRKAVVAACTAVAVAATGAVVPQASAIEVVSKVSTSKIQDTMFVIDTTASMTNNIASAKAQARELALEILRNNPNSRVGLVQYRDYHIPWTDANGHMEAARTVVDLTGSPDAFVSGVDSLKVAGTGSGDGPEDMLSGIVEAFGQDWNPNATRNVIVIGDAPAHNPECTTGFSLENVVAYAQGSKTGVEFKNLENSALTSPTGCEGRRDVPASKRPVFKLPDNPGGSTGISVILNDVDGTSRELARRTGGVDLEIGTGGLGTTLIDTQKLLAKRPEVKFEAPEKGAAGWSVKFGSQGNVVYNPGSAKVTIDFGDGSKPVDMSNGTAWHRYDKPGTYTATVTVTDGVGATGAMSRKVVITEDDSFSNSSEAGSAAVQPWNDPEGAKAGSADLSAQGSSVTKEATNGKVNPKDTPETGKVGKAIVGVIVVLAVLASIAKDIPGLDPVIRGSLQFLSAFAPK